MNFAPGLARYLFTKYLEGKFSEVHIQDLAYPLS
jgi:hypothetical protein